MDPRLLSANGGVFNSHDLSLVNLAPLFCFPEEKADLCRSSAVILIVLGLFAAIIFDVCFYKGQPLFVIDVEYKTKNTFFAVFMGENHLKMKLQL